MDSRATAADAPGSGADQREYPGEERRQRHLQIIWAGADVGGLFAANVRSFANNLGSRPPFATNLGRKLRCLWVGPRMFVGCYRYRGEELANRVKATFSCELEIVQRTTTAFKILPRRRVVGRTLAWLSRYRRLGRIYEKRVVSSVAMIWVSSIRILLKKLGAPIPEKGSA